MANDGDNGCVCVCVVSFSQIPKYSVPKRYKIISTSKNALFSFTPLHSTLFSSHHHVNILIVIEQTI